MDRQSDPSSVETVAVVSRQSTSSGGEEGRFLPGTLPGGRYRIIALPGRGGMGEVYRATDLTPGQSVALKFLPEEASRDQRLLERFHGEVRVARQVSYPNVCRVYDIGEIEGTPFISSGICRRRGPGFAAHAHRTAAGRQGARNRAQDLRRTRRRARPRCHSSRPQAAEHHAEQKTWYTPSGLASAALMLGIAVWSFWRSLGSRGLFGAEAAESR
jgi:hypothetical protein